MGPIRMVVPQAGALGEMAPGADAWVRFLDSRGVPTGRRRRVTVAPAPVLEAPTGDGGIAQVESQPLIAFRVRLPPGAHSFRLEQPGRAPILARIADAASPFPRKPDADPRWFDNKRARFRIAMLADRFEHAEEFFAHCAALRDAIRATAPFNETPDQVAIVGLWWRSTATRGNFDPLTEAQDTDLIFGDRPLAAAFLKKARVDVHRAVVLVNHGRRGGAGGTEDFPAFVTNTNSTTDRWTDVAIHELGHALGLGDEYDSANSNAPPGIEPNISDDPDPLKTPWKHLVNAPPGIPTAPFNGGQQLAGRIGTFQGARYEQTKFYRPSFSCMMRSTRDPFCPRCQELIRQRLIGT